MVKLDALKARADEVQRARPALAFPFAVVKKFGDDSSSNLAVVITYYAFFSVFPLLLALSSLLGYVLAGHPGWQQQIEGSALQHLPLVKGSPLPQQGSILAAVIGFVLALYSGLAVAKAGERAWDTVYGVSGGKRPGFLWTNLRALRLVVIGGLGLIVTTAIAGTVTSGAAVGLSVGWGLTVVGIVVSAVLNTGLFAVIFRWLTVRDVTFREVLPGAALAAVVLAVLQSLASAIISHKLKGASSTYGSFGTVIVLLSWFFLQAQVLLLAAQVNVVRQDRLWPRSLVEQGEEGEEGEAKS